MALTFATIWKLWISIEGSLALIALPSTSIRFTGALTRDLEKGEITPLTKFL